MARSLTPMACRLWVVSSPSINAARYETIRRVRSDPSDTGGLFVGRRPGTAPVRYRSAPEPTSVRRRRTDATLANALFVAMVVLCLLCWGPIPIACLWLGSRAQYWSNNANVGILVTFGSAAAALYGSLSVLQRLDGAWVLVRRASGRDQRRGLLGLIFASAAVACFVVFSFWFLVILGPNDPNL